MIIDQSECLICFFLCTELTLFCTELPENCIYLNQSELSNFSMYIIRSEIICMISTSNGCEARVSFEVTSMISDQNSTTQSSITALLHSFSVKAQNSVAQIKDFSVILHKYLIDPYQTLSPVRRTFVFLDSRCTQPLTPRNAHALRDEFSKWRTGQRGK